MFGEIYSHRLDLTYVAVHRLRLELVFGAEGAAKPGMQLTCSEMHFNVD